NDDKDDTAALQRALNHLSGELIADAGVCLYLPTGTYLITNRLHFASLSPRGSQQGITIRGDNTDYPRATIISSSNLNGALLFTINDTNTPYNFSVGLQDLQFRAEVANAGAAIEIIKSTGKEVSVRTTPLLHNVKITRADIHCYFTYGFKAKDVTRPVFQNMDVLGNRPGMLACISLDEHYGCEVANCSFNAANAAIDTTRGGEGNSTAYTVITNVNVGIRMSVEAASGPSASGATIRDNTICAYQTGVSVDKKNFITINNNVFARSGTGTGAYTNIYVNQLRQSIISENIFTGGDNQYGIVLEESRANIDNQNTIAYNTFGPFLKSILIGTNVSLTKIIDNGNIQTNIFDYGIGTYVVHGAMRPFLDSPARYKTDEDLRWSTLNCSPIVNVTNYNAKGDGVTDDTTAITQAVAQLLVNLNTLGQGSLYFPAGRYKLSKQITLSQNAGNWQKMTIFGDGNGASDIVATGTNGVFKITCTNQVLTRIHDLRMTACQTNSGTAIELIQQKGTNNGARSLILHDVTIDSLGLGNIRCFKTGVKGQGLVRPLFQGVWIDLRANVGATGIKLDGGYGFDWWHGGLINNVETAAAINSLGGAIVLQSPGGFACGLMSTGLTVNAGGGTFALNGTHINALNNLIVSNASTVSVMNVETLWSGMPNDIPSSTLRFSSCTNIYIRDCFLYSAAATNRPLNTFVLLEGNKNRNVDISGNMLRFYDYEGTGINISKGTTNVSVYDNRFFNFPLVDIVNSEPTAAISMLPVEMRPELAGYWGLEEGSGSTAYGRCYVQNGTISGATWVAGKYGTGLYFDGITDSVATTVPQFKEVMSNFTMMAWVKPEKGISGGARSATQSYAFTLVNGDELSPNGVTNIHRGVALSVGTNGVQLVEHGTIPTGWDTPVKITLSANLSSTVWTHVAVTYSNCVPRLYVNGVLKASGTASTGKIPHPGCNFGGNFSWGPYKGSMDEMRVLNRALSAVEITAEMAKSDIWPPKPLPKPPAI
ncbi:MAG: glycosyl hydrolase family 28-related protein, partial [Kiritimatiellales bacterium]